MQIKSRVEEALTDEARLDASGIEVTVQNGLVMLIGIVESRGAKRRAENLIDAVSGARDAQVVLRSGEG